MGVRKDDLNEFKAATELAPHKTEYWDALALAYFDQNRFVDAAKAWRSAEQAATEPAEREKMHKKWADLEAKRLDHEDADKKRIADERALDLQRLKDEAAARLHAAEAKVNAGAKPAGAEVPVVDWDEINPIHLEGTLKHVDCAGAKTTIVTVESADHQEIRLLVHARGSLVCGAPRKPVHVAVDYQKKVDTKLGVVGEVPGLHE
jgi:hypothetical protein